MFFNGVDFSANARLSQLTVQGGFNFGRTTSDSCEIRAKVPESALLDPYCHVVTGYLPYYKGLATYTIPKVDMQLGLTFLSKPGMVVSFAGTPTNGGHLRANYTVSNAAIAPILVKDREIASPDKVRTATFYSISNCQRGLAGVSFGNFLIKQVVEEVSREVPGLQTFVTLSPVTTFSEWLKRERADEKSAALTEADKAAFAALDQPGWWHNAETAAQLQDPVMRAAAWYFLRARSRRGTPVDAVARFHLGNGARLERINWLADASDRAMAQAHGLMVNYLYDLDDIEKNHEAYAEGPTVVASNAVQRLLRPPLELVPIAG